MDWISLIMGIISVILSIIGLIFPNLKGLFDLFGNLVG